MVRANEQLVRNIMHSGGFTPANEALHGWVILIDDKIYRPRVGTFIYRTRQQAVKSLYNGMSWRVARHYSYFRERGESVQTPPWTDGCWRHRGEYWRDFKNYLGDRLKIVRV